MFNHSSCSHPSPEVVVHLFLSLKWWQSSILWNVLCRFHSLYHCSCSLLLIAIRCHSLLLVVTLYHLLYHSLSFVFTRCHSLSLAVPLVATCCHSLSLDVPLVCLFINDLYKVWDQVFIFLNYFNKYI